MWRTEFDTRRRASLYGFVHVERERKIAGLDVKQLRPKHERRILRPLEQLALIARALSTYVEDPGCDIVDMPELTVGRRMSWSAEPSSTEQDR